MRMEPRPPGAQKIKKKCAAGGAGAQFTLVHNAPWPYVGEVERRACGPMWLWCERSTPKRADGVRVAPWENRSSQKGPHCLGPNGSSLPSSRPSSRLLSTATAAQDKENRGPQAPQGPPRGGRNGSKIDGKYAKYNPQGPGGTFQAILEGKHKLKKNEKILTSPALAKDENSAKFAGPRAPEGPRGLPVAPQGSLRPRRYIIPRALGVKVKAKECASVCIWCCAFYKSLRENTSRSGRISRLPYVGPRGNFQRTSSHHKHKKSAALRRVGCSSNIGRLTPR